VKVVCAAMPGPGHAFPMLCVARALARRGHDVVFSSSPEHAPDAADAGATSVPLPLTEGSPLHDLRPYLDSEHLARAYAPIVGDLAPDVMVVDLLTLGAGLAAEMNRVRYANLLVHGLHLPSPDLPPFGWGGPPGRGIMRARDAWMRRGQRRDLARARAHLNRARIALKLPPTARLDAQLSPDLLLVATLPSLEPPRRRWPTRAHVIGPCLWPTAAGAPEPPPGEGPLVLIAATTAWDNDRILRAGLDAVAALGARAIVTMGKAEIAGPLPPYVVAVRFASHDDVLPWCDAVVCNGGHGIVARALTNGVPLVVLPAAGDQRENGYRVERAGAGVRVLRPAGLERALRRILTEPGFRARAEDLRREATTLDGPGTAAVLVEALAAGRVPVATPPWLRRAA